MAARFRIEEVSLSDEAQRRHIAEVLSEVHAGHPYFDETEPEELFEEVSEWQEFVEKLKGKVFAAFTPEGKMIGFAVGHLFDPTEHPVAVSRKLGKGPHYYLMLSAVLPLFRRGKVATELNLKRMEHARELDCKNVVGETEESNKPRITQFLAEDFKRFHITSANYDEVLPGVRHYYYRRQIG